MRKPLRSDRAAAAVSTAAPASTDSKRRRFLLAFGAGTAAAASAAAVPGVAAEPLAQANDDEDGRYSETRHVRDYYRTTRI